MAIIESKSTGSHTTGDLVITKPSGLAVDDLMVAVIQGRNASPTAPSGFTSITTISGGGGISKLFAYYKIAVSGDVSASDFTFTNNDTKLLGGAIFRISGFNALDPVSVFNQDEDSATSTPSFTTSCTPTNANSLLLFCVGSADTTQNTVSGYAIATSNPSWTEEYDIVSATADTGNYFQNSVASAIRPEVTATGNASCTISNVTLEGLSIMLVIRPPVTITATETSTTTDTLNKTPNKIILETSVVIDTEEATKGKIWNNTDKNSSSWVNQDKH